MAANFRRASNDSAILVRFTGSALSLLSGDDGDTFLANAMTVSDTSSLDGSIMSSPRGTALAGTPFAGGNSFGFGDVAGVGVGAALGLGPSYMGRSETFTPRGMFTPRSRLSAGSPKSGSVGGGSRAAHAELTLSKLREALRALESEQLGVAVTGCVNAGKSTLVNLLLRQELCPRAPIPSTFRTTSITFGDQYSASVPYTGR